MNFIHPTGISHEAENHNFLKQYEALEQAFESLGKEVPIIRMGSPAETLMRMQMILHDLQRQRDVTRQSSSKS